MDRAPVELLGNFALVTTDPAAPPLHGRYLHHMAAFLDRRFRAHDFRRGAADARRTATDLLGLSYTVDRPDGFYTPDADPDLAADLDSYGALDRLASSSLPGHTVREAFEAGLDGRARYLIAEYVRRSRPPGPDRLYDALLDGFYDLVRPQIRAQIAAGWAMPA